MCVRVCMCVCPTWDIRNGTSYRHAAYTILKNFAWLVAQTACRAYTTRDSREKLLKNFRQLLAKFRARTATLPVTLNRMNLAHYWIILEGHTLKDTLTTSRVP